MLAILTKKIWWGRQKTRRRAGHQPWGHLAVYRLVPSEKEIHFAFMSVANAKLAPMSAIAFHDQPAGALFAVAARFSCSNGKKKLGHSGQACHYFDSVFMVLI